MFLLQPFAVRLPANTRGRDFVVGDLHGCFDELTALLHHVCFDTERDRLFCTGDLTHRGPKGAECLKLLNQPWFFSVLGNHDMPSMITDGADFEMRRPFMQELAWLPLIYQVGDTDSTDTFFVVHAELPFELLFSQNQRPSNYKSNQDFMLSGAYSLAVRDSLCQIIAEYEKHGYFLPRHESGLPDALFQTLVWGRSLWKQGRDTSATSHVLSAQANPLRLFCGHSPVPSVQQIGHQIFCDTGACFAYRPAQWHTSALPCLSMVDTMNGTIHHVVGKALTYNHIQAA